MKAQVFLYLREASDPQEGTRTPFSLIMRKSEKLQAWLNRRIRRCLVLGVAAATLASTITGCEYFPESTFKLANESRLPKWFAIPPGLVRTDISVTMNYYVTPSGRTATFVLQDTKNKVLKKVKGKLACDQPFQLENPTKGSALGYPSYERITVDGKTEMIEHRRMEPIFYVSDDMAILKEYATAGCR